ncbi:hypothetical protein [Burkholderia multivorans]|uniref:hypothetical protein n=1 Tax=Burkholderia multivorans TaxID=87883 RepID=UPI00285E158E|nr:hypothetical protein [Burkholderia multivorans]MCA8478248.1 hypothetical protein [Burkholderia multivorans]MDR8916659.1 hypothetical protein [Burkholderia multivorans]MDR8922056.1 hypothetical protein [Burkholderia multivorans]MDR8965576.1 hypothetical protein [Burkholderia multivorans]MDR8991064.1 hypothetical protein [Burkholderia multivorans]
MSEKRSYEVLVPVRFERRSRAVGARIDAHPDHVADLVAGCVLRAVDDAATDRPADDGGRLEGNANSRAAMEAAQPGASTGHEGTPQGSEGEVKPVTNPTKASTAQPGDTTTKSATKRSGAQKARK